MATPKSKNQSLTVIRANARRPRDAKGHWITKLNDEVIDRISTAIYTGASLKSAAAIAGVDESTLTEWLKQGRNEGGELEQRLAVEVGKALAHFKARLESTVAAHAEGDWRAAAWRLERSFPDEYGPTRRVEVGGPGGGPVQVDHEIRVLHADKLSDAELELIAQADRLALGAADIIDGEIVELPDRGNVAGEIDVS